MIYADQLRDAVRVAGKAAHPTSITLVPQGFRVAAAAGGLRSAQIVSFDELEVAPSNPLVEAVRTVNAKLA